jgi:predicted dehydrogenase
MTVSLGILSAAHLHSNAYASVVDGLDDAELVGVADDDEERGREFAADHDTEFAAAGDLLEAADGVVVCSANADHVRWVEAAADAGVDVLCEKPLAPEVAEAERIVGTCEAAGVHLGVAMPLRFSHPARDTKERLTEGELGELRAISGTNRGKMPDGWFADPDASGGGAVLDHTVHIVDLVHWLTGERVSEVYAETATRIHDVPVEDVNVLSMELTDGTQFSLDGSWSRPERWDFWGDATVELVGDDAVLSVDCFDQTFEHTRDGEAADGVQSVYWGTDPNEGLIADFADAVLDGRPPEISGSEGVDAVRVVAAAYESAERGEPVAVTY